VAPQEPSALIKPLPLWLFLLSILVVAAVLIVLVFLTGADWAAGAQTASVVALAVGGLILVAFGVRSALGMLAQTNLHRRSQIVSAILLALLLFAIAAVGLTQQSGIHTVQAHSLEGQQKWQVAINEYIDSGQHAPSSVDIARTYNDWGEQLAGQQQYTDSLDKFNTVIANYTQAGSELTRAQTGAASAYYNLAEQDMAAQKFSDAVTNFNQLTTNFSSSAYVQRAHADYAKALWGEAQPELTSACSSALALYQQLSSQFSDTQDGQQAKAALALPQSVKGHFTSTIPSGTSSPQVGLTQGISASMSTDAFYAILAKSPVVTVHSDGTFTFPTVNQGSYYLVWGVVNSASGNEDFLVGQRYPATVGPLCAFNFGDISENFPTA
jgi:tetratricopeptide (TPR) repeat protein